MTSRLNDALGTLLPPQTISISSHNTAPGHIQHTVVLKPLTQLMTGVCAAALTGWLAVGTASMFLSGLQEAEHRAETALLSETYESRLADVTAERDALAMIETSIGERLIGAQNLLAEQQTRLMAALERHRETHVELGLMRTKLQVALEERDAAVSEGTQLLARLSDLTGNLEERFGAQDDVQETLVALSGALEDTAAARDAALVEQSTLQADIAALELRMQVNADRQERMVAQLEEAVEVSFAPLEAMFRTSGMDVDSIVSNIRRNYSGMGGPLIKSSVSTRSFDDPALTERFASLMEGMDRINVMRMAADKLPYAMPVKSGYRHTSGFGTRRDPKTGGYRSHNGIDLAGARGTAINATADGEVIFAGRQSGFGKLIKIRHSFGFTTLYAHLNHIRVKVGDRVSRGDRIGDMGSTGRSTGTHLHYEVRIGGKPVNPMTYIKAARNVF